MASYGWRKDASLEEWLFNEGHAFEFFQAVRLLEILFPERIPVGEGSDPSRVVVMFQAKTGLDFPASEVERVIPPEKPGEAARMKVNVLSLSGALGPLPHAYTEVVLDRLKHHDTAMRDFLDIFNHRLISLLYRVRKTMRLGFDFKSPDRDPFHRFFYCLGGLGTGWLRGRMQAPDRSLLYYTGLLAMQPRSMAGLEAILSDFFGVPVQGRAYRGKWYNLEDTQVTRIGGWRGQNRTLGVNAVLGGRVWDQERTFRLVLGPLTFRQFEDFLPINDGFTHLCELTRFYTGDEFDYDIQLVLRAVEVPASRLSARHGPRLGWTSWLRTRFFRRDDDQVVLSPGYQPPNAWAES